MHNLWLQRRALVSSCMVLGLLLGLVGCGDPIADGVAAMNKTKIQQLYNCYKLYLGANSYRAPQDEAELKEFLLRPRYKKNLVRMQIDRDQLDQLFVNDRDGEPFKIRYGINGLGNKAVIFEAKGVDGKRRVALEPIEELEEKEYDAYWTGKAKPQAMKPAQTNY